MRFLRRFLFALAAAMGLYLVFNMSHAYVVTTYLQTEGAKAIEREDYAFFISARYHDEDLVFDDVLTFDDKTFVVKVYNVANIMTLIEGYLVVEGFFVLMHQIEGEPLREPFAALVSSTDGDIEQRYTGINLGGLPMYTFIIAETQSTIINKNLFIREGVFYDIDQITIRKDDEDIGVINLLLQEGDLKLRDPLEGYLLEHDSVPKASFETVVYAPVIDIDSSSVVIRNVIIYLLVVLLLTILLFYVKSKYMGRGKPTPGVQRDLEKLKQNNGQKR